MVANNPKSNIHHPTI